MIKLILLDIDGTLTNKDKVITPRTHDALMRAQEAGIRLVLASGRPTRGLDKFADMLDMRSHHGLYVRYNGAQVVDCESREVWFNQAMSVEDARAVLTQMRKFPRIRAMIDHGDYMYVENVFDCMIKWGGGAYVGNDAPDYNVYDYEAHNNGFQLAEYFDMADRIDWEPNKILTTGDPDYLKEHAEEFAAPFAGRLSAMFTGPFYFEFTPLGIDKARAMKEAFESRGYSPDEMIAFGDGQNDASMCKYAGTGVAMANAVDELKAVCDEVTLSNEEDGIAASLERHLPELFA